MTENTDQREMTEAEEEAAKEAAEAANDAPQDVEGEQPESNKLPEFPIAHPTQVTTQAELQEVLARHAQWMEGVLSPRVVAPGGRANLSGADLRSLNLTHANLSSADLSNTDMSGMDLTGVNFSVANLTGANLAGAILRDAKLRGARVKDADFRAVDFTGCRLDGVDMTTAIMTSADYEKRQGATVVIREEAAPASAEDVEDDLALDEAQDVGEARAE